MAWMAFPHRLIVNDSLLTLAILGGNVEASGKKSGSWVIGDVPLKEITLPESHLSVSLSASLHDQCYNSNKGPLRENFLLENRLSDLCGGLSF